MLAATEGATDVRPCRFVLGVLAAVGMAASVIMAAPAVQLVFKDGRVWLAANGATVNEILAEWARAGGTRIVNADRIGSPPLTLDLRDVPEMQALDVVLRSAGGFIAAPRAAEPGGPAPSLSRFDRILVLPISQRPDETTGSPASLAPAAASLAPAPPVLAPSGVRRLIGQDGQPVPDDQDAP
jgi:hypothetical protein